MPTPSRVRPEHLTELFPEHVAHISELVRLGLSGSGISYRCRPGGPWQRLFPGVVLMSDAPPTRDQLVHGALRYGGYRGLPTRSRGPCSTSASAEVRLTGLDAVRWHGLDAVRTTGPVQLLVPHHRQVAGTPRVTVERTRRLPPLPHGTGPPVAPAARAALDAARRLRDVGAVRALLTAVVRCGLATPGALRAELGSGSRRGSAVPRQVIDELADGPHTTALALARRLLAASRLPVPRWNAPVPTGGGLLALADAWWPEVGLAWQIDTTRRHGASGSPPNGRAEPACPEVLFLRTPVEQLWRRPDLVLHELCAAYREAAYRSWLTPAGAR